MLQALLVLNALLQWADAASTLWFLDQGGEEGNPLVRAMMDAGGVGVFLVTKLVVAFAMLLLLPYVVDLEGAPRRHAVMATAGFGLLMTLVVANNVILAATT